jgi:hypothetical protein
MSHYFLVMRVPVTRGAVLMNDWLVEYRHTLNYDSRLSSYNKWYSLPF